MSQARKYRRDTYRRAGLLKAKNEWGRFSEKGIAWYAMKQDEGKQFQEAHQKKILGGLGGGTGPPRRFAGGDSTCVCALINK